MIEYRRPSDPTVCAYIAGIIDGEGCIAVNRQGLGYHFMSVTVANTNAALIGWLVQQVGGAAGVQGERDNPKWKPRHTWRLTGHKAADLLDAVRPFLVLKREQADLAIEFMSIKEGHRMTDIVKARREAIHEKCAALNARGVAVQ